MEYVELNNGVKMPQIGYGTYQTPAARTEKAVSDALSVGYRLIDTAQCYGNESEVGSACRNSGLQRSELFITTKLWACHGYEDTLRSIERSLLKLNLDYIDLLLIHEPTGNVHEIYRAVEKAYFDGNVRAIGVSNFLEDRYLDIVEHSTIIPAVNQVETHVFRQQEKLRKLEWQIGTKHESWSPLACGEHGIFSNKVLSEIAHSHERNISQIALRFLVQQGIIVIPKSLSREHMRENMEIFDFALTSEEMNAIKVLDEGRSLFGWW